MQVWTWACGNTAVIASGNPFKPSTTAMRMSSTPVRSCASNPQLGHHQQPELGALGLLDPQAQDLLAAVGTDTEGEVDRLVADRALVADLHPQGIEEHQGIDYLERPILPLGDLVQDGVGHRADQVG